MLTLVLLSSGCRNREQAGRNSPASAPAPAKTGASLHNEQLQEQLQQQQKIGHAATVRCLRGERATTDGDELRCEDWPYVISNYSQNARILEAGR